MMSPPEFRSISCFSQNFLDLTGLTLRGTQALNDMYIPDLDQ